MNLFEITKQLHEVMSIEDVPAEQLIDTIDCIEGEFSEKTERVAAYILEQRADIKSLQGEIDRLTERKRVISNKSLALEEYLRTNMIQANKLKINGKLVTITIGKPTQSLYIEKEAKIPDEFIRTIKEPDNALIKEKLKSGATIEGCALVDGKARLIIK